jgi:flagellar hook-associated protein 3 FlgL
MTRLSLGDASMTSLLSRQAAALRGKVAQTANEVATGRPTDLARALGGDISPLVAIDATLGRLQSFKATTGDAAFQTAAQQAALTGLSSLAEGITTTLLGARDFPTAVQVDTVAADARARLESAVGLLNSQTAGRAIFSGVATDTVPLGSADDLLTALETAAAAATTAGQVAAAITNWFASPSGYESFYQGGAALGPAPIAPGEEAELSTTALDPAIRDSLAAFSMAALLDRGILSGNADERARLARRAGEGLLTSEDSRITLAARIGTVEAQIESARVRNGAEETALGIYRSEMASVDPYDAATRLETARTQLESLYLVTARVSRLSLVEFLR